MKIEEVKKKYKKYWKKMQEHLDGITCSYDKDGDLDIPERDLLYAFDMVTKGVSNLEWD